MFKILAITGERFDLPINGSSVCQKRGGSPWSSQAQSRNAEPRTTTKGDMGANGADVMSSQCFFLLRRRAVLFCTSRRDLVHPSVSMPQRVLFSGPWAQPNLGTNSLCMATRQGCRVPQRDLPPTNGILLRKKGGKKKKKSMRGITREAITIQLHQTSYSCFHPSTTASIVLETKK